METLRAELNGLLARLSNEAEVKERLETLISVYPFNEYEYWIAVLLGEGVLSLDAYFRLREEYVMRNRYLPVFRIAPRLFGDWAEAHLKEQVPDLVKPYKKYYPAYGGEYDVLLDEKIRIEVKASRAVALMIGKKFIRISQSLDEKALYSDSPSKFVMNFQQIKPDCCDVFVWMGVWRDRIKYWVLASREVADNRAYSAKQHRNSINEGQLHLNKENQSNFDQYEFQSEQLAQAIRDAYARQMS